VGKIINDRSALKHRYMTTLRRLDVLVEGTKLDFMDHLDAKDMVEFERDWMLLLKRKGISVPEFYGVHRLNYDDYILVMEFIEGQPLSKVRIDDAIVDQIFSTLKIMHDTGVFHGDMKLDNLIYSNGRIYVIDSLKINPNDPLRAQAFDLISIVLALARSMPVDRILASAKRYHSQEALKSAAEFLGMAQNKADIELSPEKIDEIRLSLNLLKTAA
jgi:RIO-like serine/threonine protein kinase